MISTSPSLICPDCKGENALDSRFCRHCGHAFDAATVSAAATAPITAPVTAPATAFATDSVTAEPVAAGASAAETPAILAPGEIVDEPLSSPGEIDGRRAIQLLDRALHLSERGDAGGAILACRQSIALAPGASDGHAMLGLLLERAGDLPHAMAAYDRAVQLAPDGVIEREGLERLQQKIEAQRQNQPSDTLFHFDDDELFADESSADGKAEAPVAAAAGGTGSGGTGATEALALDAVLADAPANSAVADGSAATETMEAAEDSASEMGARQNDRLLDPVEASNVAVVAAPATTPAAIPPAKAKVAPVVFERRVKARRRFNVPITVERRNGFDRRAVVTAVPSVSPRFSSSAASASRAGAAVPVVAPIFAAPVAAPSNPWVNLWSRPSYFGRSLPLVGATVVALGLLGTARSGAVARSVEAQMRASSLPAESHSEGGVAGDGVAPGAPQVANATGLPPLAPIGPSQPQVQGIAPISNAPAAQNPAPGSVAPAAPAAPSSRTSGARSTATRSNTGNRAPRFPQSLAPAFVSPVRNSAGGSSSGNGSNAGSGSSSISLPAPDLGSSEPAAPPVMVLPPGSSSALVPGGSPGRGYVRITQGRIGTAGSSALPQRPAAQGNTDERAAASASSSGQTDRAIERLGAAISASASDAGYRYQQRATLFLERGDYSRAADDFQSAITAYNSQIDRGDQVASARAGLRAARSGLNLALAGGR